MWSPRNRVGYSRRISAKVSSLPVDERNSVPEDASFSDFDEHVLSMKVWILYEKLLLYVCFF